jgi:hypothetical protein
MRNKYFILQILINSHKSVWKSYKKIYNGMVTIFVFPDSVSKA